VQYAVTVTVTVAVMVTVSDSNGQGSLPTCPRCGTAAKMVSTRMRRPGTRLTVRRGRIARSERSALTPGMSALETRVGTEETTMTKSRRFQASLR
jgi:hypothetical protein